MTMDSATARRGMVEEQLRARGLGDERVLKLMEEIPRERFLPSRSAAFAYEDRALSIECGQTISQPYIVALMTTMLGVEPEHRVLEVGTGTGYQTAILAGLAKRVFTIERIASLLDGARARLAGLEVDNVEFLQADGSLGLPEHQPFDRIVVTAASPQVPQPLVDQLTEGGRLVLPVGPVGAQMLTLVERCAGRTVERPGIGVRFVKLLGAYGFRDEAPIEPGK